MRVDFYFNVDHRLHYACRVIRKARAAGKRAVVYTCQPDRLAQFDNSLWTFSALDFVPHVYADSPLAAATPVVLAASADAAPDSDVLLTLDDDAPPRFEEFFARYQRVIEIVSSDDEDKKRARLRFKNYREHGLQPTAFEVKNGEREKDH